MATAIIYGAPGTGKTVNSTLVPGKTLLLSSDNSAIINLKEAGALLGLSEESVRRYCVTGDIPAIQIGKQWRIDKEMLMKKFGY